MAYQTIATRWLLSQKDGFDVSFMEHKWDIDHAFPFTDIEVSIHLASGTIVGRGTDLIGDIALEKASSEVIERWCCHELNISTVGCAVHSDKESADLNSKNEFIERLAFNKFKNREMTARILHTAKTQEISKTLIDLYAESKVLFYELTPSTTDKIILCLISNTDTPISLGLALDTISDTSVQKSFIEALRNYVSYKTDANLFFSSIQRSHDFWCCNPTFLNQLEILLKTDAEISSTAFLKPKTTTTSRPVSEIVGIPNCPLFFSRTIDGCV